MSYCKLRAMQVVLRIKTLLVDLNIVFNQLVGS